MLILAELFVQVDAPQPDDVLGWLDADAHLVAIVLVADGDAMYSRADQAAQDGTRFGDAPRLVAAVLARIHDSVLPFS